MFAMAALRRGFSLLSRRFSTYFPREGDELAKLCDVNLLVGDEKLPVHSGVLATESRIFSKALSDLKPGSDGMPTLQLHESIDVEDAQLMLTFLYGTRANPSFGEAARLMSMGKMYDIPKIAKAAEEAICKKSDDMYFMEGFMDPWSERFGNVGQWLQLADHFDLPNLRAECQRIILRDTINAAEERLGRIRLESATTQLEGRGIKVSTLIAITGCLARMIFDGKTGPVELRKKDVIFTALRTF